VAGLQESLQELSGLRNRGQSSWRRAAPIKHERCGSCRLKFGNTGPVFSQFGFRPCGVENRTDPNYSGCALFVSSSAALAFATGVRARHPHQSFRGCRVRLMLQPGRWLAVLVRTLTLELSPGGSPRTGVEYDYVGRQPVPATGLSPASHAALWAAHSRRFFDRWICRVPALPSAREPQAKRPIYFPSACNRAICVNCPSTPDQRCPLKISKPILDLHAKLCCNHFLEFALGRPHCLLFVVGECRFLQ
jgi:hypothetical protein